MLHLDRRPMRALRALVASALLFSMVVVAPTAAMAAPTLTFDKPSTALQVAKGESVQATFTASWGQLDSEQPTLTVSALPAWLGATPASVEVTSNASQEVTLSVDTAALDVGLHEATATVAVDGAVLDHTVSLEVLDPYLTSTALPALDPPLAGQVSPSGDVVDIYRFSLEEGQFLRVSVAQTTEATAAVALFAPGTASVAEFSAALSTGTASMDSSYTGEVTANASEAGEYYLAVVAEEGVSEYTIDWTISNPTFSLASPSTAISVVRGSDAATQTLRIDWGELGSEPVTFTVESDQQWLSAVPATDTAASGASTPVTLDASTTALPLGAHEATVTVRLLGAPQQTHRFSVTVLDKPTFSISASVGTAPLTTQTVKYGTWVTFKGTLRDSANNKLVGRPAVLKRYRGSEWVTVSVAPTSTTGDYSASVPVYENGRFRWYFAGDSQNAQTYGVEKSVKSYASVTRPNVPKRVRPRKNYRFYGYLKPQHTNGSQAVNVQFQYYYRGKWRSDGKPLRTWVSNPTGVTTHSVYRYADRYSIGVPVRWRVRAYHPKDANHETTYSSWRYYKVY